MRGRCVCLIMLLGLEISGAMVDVKWTPASDKPSRPFSKKYRDANPEPEDEALGKSQGIVGDIVDAVLSRPVHAAVAVGMCGGAYGAYKLRKEVKDGWPIAYSRSSPWMSFLKPSQGYARRVLLKRMGQADFSHPAVISPAEGKLKGFSHSHHQAKVGTTEADYNIAVRAMRAWRMCESVSWLDLHVSREAGGSVIREEAALLIKSMCGHVLAPMRVCGSEIQGTESGAANVQADHDAKHDGKKVLKSTIVCASLEGHFLDARVTFTVEFREGNGANDGVWFKIDSATRKAARAFTATHFYLSGLHRWALAAMCKRMPASVESMRRLQAVRDAKTCHSAGVGGG